MSILHERSMNKMTTGTDINNSSAPIPSLSRRSDRLSTSHMSDIQKTISSIFPSFITRLQANPSTPSPSTLTIFSVPEPITVPHRSPKAVRNGKIPRSGELLKERKPLCYAMAISNVKSSEPFATIASLSSSL